MEFIPGPMELVLILIIVAMLFGVGRLPEVFGAVGKGLREFRREMAAPPTSNAATDVARSDTDVQEKIAAASTLGGAAIEERHCRQGTT